MLGIQRILSIKIRDVSLKRVLFALFRRIKFLFILIEYFLPFGFYLENRNKIKSLRNSNVGKRCFIVATGPSLNKINFEYLNNEMLISMNKGYLIEDKFDVTLNYLMCIDNKTQLKQFTKEYDDLVHIPTFYDFRLHKLFKKTSKRVFILNRFSPKFISKNGTVFGNGKSVTYNCIQLAFYLGYSEVYLIGKDHSYKTNYRPGESVKVDEKTDNHFTKSYYKNNNIYDAPDFTTEEFAYKVALDHFTKNRRLIMDATINGKLEVFPKVNFDKIFS